MTPEDSVTTRVLVHDANLTGTALVEEAFLKEGQGSAFVSRPNELVVLAATQAGLPAIQPKIAQLVERGFHSIVVSLAGISVLEKDNLKLLLKARSYVENWGGSLRLCDVGPELASLMKTLGLDKDLASSGTRAQVVEKFRRQLSGEPEPTESAAPAPSPAPLGESGPLKLDWVLKGDGAAAPATSSSSEDGIRREKKVDAPAPEPVAAAPAAEPLKDGELPSVDVAELVVPAEELPKLRRTVEGVLARGKRYVTVRLSFKKRMRSEDVTVLTDIRDFLAEKGGQLALASLQQDVATWLKLLDYDREFLIFDDADAAELAHRKHAAGIKIAPRASAKPSAPEPGFQLTGRAGSSVFVRPRAQVGAASPRRAKIAVHVVELARTGMPRLVAEVERLSSSGAKDVVVDLKALEAPRGERVETLSEAATLARMKGVRLTFGRVGRELRAFLKVMGLEGKLPMFDDEDQALVAHAQQRAAQEPFEELELVLTRSILKDEAAAPAEIKRDKKPLTPQSELSLTESSITFDESGGTSGTTSDEQPISVAEAELRMELSKTKAEAEKLHKDVHVAKSKLEESEQAKLRLERKVSELEASTRKNTTKLQDVEALKARNEGRVKELEAERDAAKAAAEKAAADVASAKEAASRAEAELAQARSAADKAVAESERFARERAELEAKFSSGPSFQESGTNPAVEEAREEAAKAKSALAAAQAELEKAKADLAAASAIAASTATSAASSAELDKARADAKAASDELEKAKSDAKLAADDLEKARGDAKRATDELAAANDKISKLEAELAGARAAAAALAPKTEEAPAAPDDGAIRREKKPSADLVKLQAELAETKTKLETELADTKKKLDHAEARFREADYHRNESVAITKSSDEARKRLEQKVESAEAESKKLAAQVLELTQQRDEASKQAVELEHVDGAPSAEIAAKVAQLENEKIMHETHTRALEGRLKELEQQLATAAAAATPIDVSGLPKDAAALTQRVAKLEREKAEILIESKREIERLSREQETLREELESAGEMIERLGKELELT